MTVYTSHAVVDWWRDVTVKQNNENIKIKATARPVGNGK
jgi:hypothetical protein